MSERRKRFSIQARREGSQIERSADELIARRWVRLLAGVHSADRAEAALRLAHYPFPFVVEALCKATTDRDARVREQAVRSLGLLRCVAAVELLGRALADPEMRVRCAALAALAELRTEAVAGVLADALEAELRLAAEPRPVSRQGFFARFRDSPFNPERSAAFRVDLVLELARRVTPAAFPTLCRAIHDPELEVRLEAAREVGRLAATRTDLPLEPALAALRRRSAAWRLPERRIIRKALDQVEQALGIAGTTDLPLPATAPGAESLPLPGTPPTADPTALPRPASPE
ncbi:MAG: HEAT repeat domain-containing protein [Armatimonadota bacterium]